MIRRIVKKITPPYLIDMVRWFKNKLSPSPFYGVSGIFASWQEALEYCKKYNHGKGYEAANIINKVSHAIQEVRNGRAEFERDSYLFYEKEYNFPLLSALFLAFNGIDNTRPIYVVDFGGSLGSTFFQNRSLFASMKKPVVWSVIEQKHFVDRGRIEVPEVEFYYDIEEYKNNLGGGFFDILLLSAVLDYIPYPEVFAKILEYPWKYILIDRSFYHPEDKEVIGVQTVPPSIYDAQYPLWLRSESKQNNMMISKGFEEVLRWDSPFSMPYLNDSGITSNIPLRGFLYKRK